MKIAWNAIVRNEAARIERCMKSLIDHVDCAVVLDTGSTDDTIKIIEAFFEAHGKDVEVHLGEFVNFEQARNDALDLARASTFEWDYLLLMDADMELVTKALPELPGGAYQAMQRAGRASEYYNTRFLARDEIAKYVGVTHEYLSTSSGIGVLSPEDVFFIDHADGANRGDKFKRDIALLEKALEEEPNNPRTQFYLAQSYRDDGQPAKAAEHYKKRVELGGWAEEQWDAQCNYAHAMKSCGHADVFTSAILEAHEMRPHRAEALYDLAKFYREAGKNRLASLFASEAMNIPRPKDDVLFVNPFVYEVGAKEEFSIAAFYDEKTRAAGFRACDSLALGAHGYGPSTQQARSNLFHYVPRAHEVLRSFWSTQLPSQRFPAGWPQLNPSVARRGKDTFCIVRTVNYHITPEGRYDIDGKGSDIAADNPIRTRNFMVRLDGGLQVSDVREIIPPSSDKFPLVLGWEDMRLFYSGGALLASATVREANEQGRCEQWVGELRGEGDHWIVEDARAMPSYQEHEKNWMPVVNGRMKFVYKLGQVVSHLGTITPRECAVNTEHLRGSSQVVPFRSGYLAVVHEAGFRPDGQRYYFHRFVFFDVDLNVQKVSLPFVFHDKQIEFCAGMCHHPDGKHLLISYGVKDKEAWVARVDANDVAEFVLP